MRHSNLLIISVHLFGVLYQSWEANIAIKKRMVITLADILSVAHHTWVAEFTRLDYDPMMYFLKRV